MMRFSELTEIVESSRSHGLRADIERIIKESYLVKRKGDDSDGDDDDGEEAGMMGGGYALHVSLSVLVFQSELILRTLEHTLI
jgi:hypothetical protein